jgi:tetratricopeptide (TPR) repeat protein
LNTRATDRNDALPTRPESPEAPFSLEEAAELLNSSLVEAETRARARLRSDPTDFNASYALGTALRRQKRYEEATQILEPLPGRQPQMMEIWFELGVALAGLGDRDGAVAALTRAIDLGWLEEDVWYALGDLLPFPAHAADKEAAADPRVAKAATALSEDRPEAAKAILRNVLASHPDNAKALKLLADALIRTDHWPEAEAALERALECAPGFTAARFRYVTMRCVQRNVRDLLPHVEELLKSDPDKLLYRALKALVQWWDRRPQSAAAEFETFIGSCADMPGLWLEYARVLRACRNKDAVAAYRKVLQLLPAFVDAYVALANMKSFRMDEALMEQMRAALENATLSKEERAKLHYALGKACEDWGRNAEAFDNYRRFNEIFCEGRASGIANSNIYLREAKSLFTPAFFGAREGFGCRERGPIFIVGMPRAGSTLVEQILSSHSQIEALGEMKALQETGQRLAPDRPGVGFPALLRDLDAQRFALIGEEYLRATRARKTSDRPWFTDKLPGNYYHTGLIHLALPNAKIIDVRRHPLDCCFSCFKHYFPGLQAMSLEDAGRAYVNYVELMAHFDEVLPGRVHRVIYEELISDPEAHLRRLLGYLDLPFEEECLRFHENPRFVATLSADQVSVPLYTSGVGHWRHYEEWLAPLKNALGAVLDAYPSVPEFPRAPTQLSMPAGGAQPGSVFLGLGRVSFGSALPTAATAGDQGRPS